jgi:hypothetical protein
MNDHHNLCDKKSSVSILQFLLNDCMQFESKHPQGCHFEKNVHTKTAEMLQKIQTGKRPRISENDVTEQ